ncbi:hypothetical protein CWE15_05600 [Aliidiomarina taiwanensis]|uniref:Penicillin-binding protein activator n=2 Tax=Aliidiomarina taiwanensis TaxID=946228 RepID=A0A432X7P6_9GAMM|nr:hypothetical protein CWE15_05600 [Aliidiomarina taiwanensis]
MCIAVLSLLGCGSTPEQQTPAPVIQAEPSSVQAAPTAEELIAAAETAATPATMRTYLLQAAAAYLDQDQPQHAGAILVELEAEQFGAHEQSLLRLQRARFYAALGDWAQVVSLLQDLDQRFTQREQRVQVLELNYQAAVAQQQHLRAADQLLLLQPYLETSQTALIWQHMRQVPADVWRSNPRSVHPNGPGWYSLLNRLTTAIDDQQSIEDVLSQWQRAFPQHPAQPIVQQLLDTPYFANPPQQVAVLLPLTGPLMKQGNAVRYGVLAALAEQGQQDVHFIDTNTYSDEDILAELEALNIELVIGPLQRERVDSLASHSVRPWLQLALNHPPQATKPAGSSYFALDIAAETQAAAKAMKDKGYQGILLLGPDNNRGRQLSRLFTRYWQVQQPTGHIRTGFYNSSADMRSLVSDRLKVAHSEARKERLEQAFPGTDIEMQFRNRQDIDAIYLLGDATQARLLKPYIDVNQSAFGKRIPVYANSMVNEQTQTQGESDLSGISFADAPWLLPQHAKQPLHQQLSSLLRGWSLSEQRLTAMGYDSMRLAPLLARMQQLQGYSYQGLSGQLRIDEQTLVRELTWAMFDGDHIRLEPLNNVDTRPRN